MSRNFGKDWILIHEFVKSFFWTSSRPKSLIIERIEPSGRSTVINMGHIRVDWLKRNYTAVINDVVDFQMRSDYMFATKKVGTYTVEYKSDPSG